jgi:hypothetical protein
MAQFSIEEAKKLPPHFLMMIINIAKQYLKNDPIMKKMCQEHGVSTDYIDLIPMKFGDLDVSARTEKGIITLNYKLLCDGNFYKDLGYLVHETRHNFQQCFSDGPTKGSDDGDYLDNKYEQDAFQHQVEFMANEYGEGTAEKYVDHLLQHHEITDKEEKEEKKDVLMSRVDD